VGEDGSISFNQHGVICLYGFSVLGEMQRRWLYVIMSGFEIIIWFISDYVFCLKQLNQMDSTQFLQ
jgi:hypothetical protein